MNREDTPENQSFEHARVETDCTKAEQAPVKARYEQSHPGESHQLNQPTSSPPWSHIGLQGSMHMSHATTSVDGRESTRSYNSTQDLTAYFREINGRRFSSQASTYMLPADETEFWRLDKQHAAFLVAMGDLYPCPDLVERVLSPRPGETVEMVDLGCGTGTWALSMARRFPHAQVLGVDLVPMALNPDELPSNIHFEIDDINQGLVHYAGRFDLVHMRCVGGGLPNYALGITYAARCLRPGGLLLILGPDMQLCAEDKVSLQKMATPNQPEGSWLQRFFYEFRWAYAANGTDVMEAEGMLDKGLWGHPLLDGCGAGAVCIPIGPWATSTELEEAQRLQFGGVLMRQNLRSAIRSFQTLMRKHGAPQSILDDWIRCCDEEFDLLKIHSWIRLRMMWGLRNITDAATALPSSSTRVSSSIVMPPRSPDLRPSIWKPHRQIHFYQNSEECEAARKRRLETIGELVEPLVLSST